MTFFCIADENSALGFKFAGLHTRAVSTQMEAREALKVALATDDVGIIVITRSAAAFIREEIDSFIYGHELPLVLEVPSRGSSQESAPVEEFLRQAVGIRI